MGSLGKQVNLGSSRSTVSCSGLSASSMTVRSATLLSVESLAIFEANRVS